jgi:hypothetical protein
MLEDELMKIWQSSPNQERIKFEKARLMMDVQSTVDDIHRKIKHRDIMEQLGALVGMPVFAYYAYHFPHPTTKIASVLIIVWGFYVIFRLRSAKKHKPGAYTESYRDYLHKTRKYLDIQKQMVDNVLYWYILPCALLSMLFVMGPGIAGRLPVILYMGVVLTGVSYGIYILNKRAVKREFLPKLRKIDELIDAMAIDDNTADFNA